LFLAGFRYVVEFQRHSTIDGAEGETRTPTEKPPLDPEPSASTNSATSAFKMRSLKKIDLKSKLFYITYF
jgi:hypothetical protein